MKEYQEDTFAISMAMEKALYREGPDGSLHLKLVASDESPDLENHITKASGFKDGLPYLQRWGKVNWDHGKGPEAVFGEIESAEISKSPITGLPALITEVRLFKHCPQTKAIKRILDSGGTIGASIQGKILKQVDGTHKGRPIKVNVAALPIAVALTSAPMNPMCGIIDLAKSFTATLDPDDVRLRDDWIARAMGDAIREAQAMDKALMAGEGIATEGSGGGTALRVQSLDGVKVTCPGCRTKNSGAAKFCTSCGATLDTDKLSKNQMSLFGDDEEKPAPKPEKPSGQLEIKPLDGFHAAAASHIQESIEYTPEQRAAMHDAWHAKASGEVGFDLGPEHHNVGQLSRLAGSRKHSAHAIDHLRHIQDYHPGLLEKLRDDTRARVDKITGYGGFDRTVDLSKEEGGSDFGKSIDAVGPGGVMVRIAVAPVQREPSLIIYGEKPCDDDQKADPAIDDLPGQELKKSPDAVSPALDDLLHPMDGLSAEDHEAHIDAHSRQADALAKVAAAQGYHFQQGEGMSGYVGRHIPTWNALQDHLKAHIWERNRKQGLASRKPPLWETRPTGQLQLIPDAEKSMAAHDTIELAVLNGRLIRVRKEV